MFVQLEMMVQRSSVGILWNIIDLEVWCVLKCADDLV